MDTLDFQGNPQITLRAVLGSVNRQVEDPASAAVIVDGYHQYAKKQKLTLIILSVMMVVFTALPLVIAFGKNDGNLVAVVIVYVMAFLLVMISSVVFMLQRLRNRMAQPFFLYVTYCRRNPTEKPEIHWTENRKMVILNMPPKPKVFTVKNVVIWLVSLLLALFLLRGRIWKIIKAVQHDVAVSESAQQWQETKDNLNDVTDHLEKTQEALDDIQIPQVPDLKLPKSTSP